MITRSLHLRTALVFVSAGVAAVLALGATNASAQTAAPPAAGSAAPAPTTAPATASGEEDPNKKKAATPDSAATAPATDAAAAPASAAAPATTSTSTETTVTFGAGGPKKDEPTKAAPKEEEAAPKPNPWRGSLLILDQSMTVNTLNKSNQLSYQPLYEWWISPRIAYSLSKSFRLGIRQDLFKEWTNVQDTTDRGEWRYTDSWLSLAYRPDLSSISKHLTGGLGLLLRPGISKESRIASQYFSTGPTANIGYGFDLAGEKAKAFKSGHVSITGMYTHAFSKCNTPCASGNFSQQRMNASGQPVDDNQVRAASMVGNQLLYSLNLGFDIVEHLDFSASMIWISQFARGTSAAFDPSGREIPRASDDTRLRQWTWFFTSVTWGFMKEASIAVGYYNLNNVLHTDGSYRQPFWSTEARVFFDLYVHLDALYEKLTGGDVGKKGGGPAGGGRAF